MKTYTQEEVLGVIRALTEASTLRQVARDVGFSAAHISDVLSGKRGVSEAIAAAFGFEREVLTEVRFRRAS